MRAPTVRSARLRAIVALVAPLLGAACATTGASFNSGVGDAFLERPPFYAGRTVTGQPAPVAHLPIGYQRGASQSPIFDPKAGDGTPVDALLREMNAYLDSLGVSARLEGAPAGTAPDVRFGCETDAAGDCVERGDSALGRGRQAMRLAVGRPSQEWIASAAGAMERAGTDHALVLTLEVGQYLMRQEGWRGDKMLDLGTGHRVRLPWLTSLETAVSVLQLTGALVGRDGKAVRVGAEGILARRTRFALSALDAQELVTADDVEAVRSLRRDDLPGNPLAWRVALRHLVAQLSGRPELATR